jgi:hypothetical protein
MKTIPAFAFIIILFCSVHTALGSPDYFHFDEITKRLTINTKMLELSIEAGAIVYIKDKASNPSSTVNNVK